MSTNTSSNLSYAVAQGAQQASIRNLPVNLFGSVMGLSGLALAWRLATPAFGASPIIGEAIGDLAIAVFVVLAVGYLAKLILYPGAVAAEFNHPIAGNFFGTITISLLLLSAVIHPRHADLAEFVWALGAAATFALSFVAASRLLKGTVDPTHLVPAWLIPGVATLDIAVAGAHMPMAWAYEVNIAAVAIGVVLALILLTLIVSRLVHRDPLAKGMVPSLMILIAPFAVGFLAYTNMFGAVDRFAAVLFYFALFTFLVLIPKVFRRDVPFAPSWWAISFPIAALSNAALKYAAVHQDPPLHLIAALILAFLTIALSVLTVRTLRISVNGKLLTA
jgi:tellurite resistance protein